MNWCKELLAFGLLFNSMDRSVRKWNTSFLPSLESYLWSNWSSFPRRVTLAENSSQFGKPDAFHFMICQLNTISFILRWALDRKVLLWFLFCLYCKSILTASCSGLLLTSKFLRWMDSFQLLQVVGTPEAGTAHSLVFVTALATVFVTGLLMFNLSFMKSLLKLRKELKVVTTRSIFDKWKTSSKCIHFAVRSAGPWTNCQV